MKNIKHRHNLKTHHYNAFDMNLMSTHHKVSKCLMKSKIIIN